jgi:hypothetical protein
MKVDSGAPLSSGALTPFLCRRLVRAPHLISTLALLVLSSRLLAQDSLRLPSQDVLKEITSYRETDAEIIAKARSLLLDCVRAGDTTKGRSVLSYLRSHYRHTRYVPFWPSEQILLWYWSSEYRAILNPSSLDALDTLGYQSSVTPPRDLLLDDLRDALNPRRMELRAAVLRAPLETHESEFLLLFLGSLLGDRRDPETQKLINEEAGDFLARFGDSPYAPFVRRDIRCVLRESRWGYGFTVGLGAGSINGNLGTLFYATGTLDLGFDLGVRHLIEDLDGVFYFRLSAGLGGRVRSAFTYNGDWANGMKQDVLVPEASVGIVAFESDMVQIVPFAGLSGIFISPPTDANGNSTSNLELNLFSWSAGLSADWKIGAGEGLHKGSYVLIRTRLTFVSPFPQPDRRFSGNIVTFTVGFGLFGRSVLRDL